MVHVSASHSSSSVDRKARSVRSTAAARRSDSDDVGSGGTNLRDAVVDGGELVYDSGEEGGASVSEENASLASSTPTTVRGEGEESVEAPPSSPAARLSRRRSSSFVSAK